MRIKHLRIGRIICWILIGHIWDKTQSRHTMSREVNRCIYCETVSYGDE